VRRSPLVMAKSQTQWSVCWITRLSGKRVGSFYRLGLEHALMNVGSFLSNNTVGTLPNTTTEGFDVETGRCWFKMETQLVDVDGRLWLGASSAQM